MVGNETGLLPGKLHTSGDLQPPPPPPLVCISSSTLRRRRLDVAVVDVVDVAKEEERLLRLPFREETLLFALFFERDFGEKTVTKVDQCVA